MNPANINVSFFAVVSMFSSSAYQMLGLTNQGQDSGAEKNIEGARTVLGYLTMLREKTAGNLSFEEETILNDVIGAIEEEIAKA